MERHLRGNPYQHELKPDGTACEDGTGGPGAVPCPACEWDTRKRLLFNSGIIEPQTNSENTNNEKHD